MTTYLDGNQTRRIYAFATGANHRFYVNYWNGTQWQWEDQGTSSGTPVLGGPGVVSYSEGGATRRIYAFVVGEDLNLHVNYWNGAYWQWADQGPPPGTTVAYRPAVITYPDTNQAQRIYAFVGGADDNLYVNYWDGFIWQWANQS